MGLFNMLFDKVASVIGNEAERQNAIARFDTGIQIALDGTVTDPRDPTKRIQHDVFSKLPVAEKMKSIAPSVEKLMQTPQIRPEDIDVQTAVNLFKSSYNSDDAIARRMVASGGVGDVKSMINGTLMNTLMSKNEPQDSKPKLKL